MDEGKSAGLDFDTGVMTQGTRAPWVLLCCWFACHALCQDTDFRKGPGLGGWLQEEVHQSASPTEDKHGYSDDMQVYVSSLVDLG